MREREQHETAKSAAKPERTTRAPEHSGAAEELLHLQRTLGNAAVAQLIQRRMAPPEPAPEPVWSGDDVLKSSGKPMDAPVRQEMESRLGENFSDVRLHTGATAQRSASEIGARAYTSGNNVVLGSGASDKHTLAHELTHVIQQRSGPVAGTDNGNGLKISDPSDSFERAAEDNAHRVMRGPVEESEG
ncbi:DUF4157 domain-containing protein [Saccharopolyspora sp. NFXS83]|uniref:eCIS core domain-containing protein n=1 Tax=Saccharopolyspora sp. NFXS83 TaxID=2993560 RepID=UPI00224AC6F5|nr:DUF4157 domain-containing protein [Saccharopolyspora sp. NFXS83]MCX2732779.1 DUF4157 domain-containing protein [Saccharopolyspora sp. NFXS83]